MAYKKTVWVDGTTKLNAEHLNHIEDGLEEASNNVDELSASKEEYEEVKELRQSYRDEINKLEATLK